LSYTEVACAKISSLVIAVSRRVSVMRTTHSSRNWVRFCRRCATSSRRSSDGSSGCLDSGNVDVTSRFAMKILSLASTALPQVNLPSDVQNPYDQYHLKPAISIE